MSRPRVLLVDDSAVARRFLRSALESDSSVEVVGTAADGRIALAKIRQLNPDLVILDVEMPEMDGLDTLREIRAAWPKLPVIMFSSHTERGGLITLDALALGASDYVTKPFGADSGENRKLILDALVPKILGLVPFTTAGQQALRPVPAAVAPATLHPRPKGRIDIVAIGVSTGGPNALRELVPALPADLPVPVVIVQHMPPMFTRLMSERLDDVSQLHVAEASHDDRVVAGSVLIAPGGRHMAVSPGEDPRVELSDGPPENSCRPSVDPLLRSVASRYGAHSLAVILTGMGRDGLAGCRAIRSAGAPVIVQDEASSVVWGMPGFVVREGLADEVVPLEAMAEDIAARAAIGRADRRLAGTPAT